MNENSSVSKAKQVLSFFAIQEYIKLGITVYGINLCYPKDGIYTINDLSVSDYFELVTNGNAFFWIIEETEEIKEKN